LLDEAGYRILGWYGSRDATFEKVDRCRPDLVLLDPDVDPHDGSSETLRTVRRISPQTHVVVLTGAVGPGLARAAARYGVRGVILRSSPLTEAVGVLDRVLEGQAVFPRALMDHLAAPDELAELSDRQRDVLRLLADGCSNEEIAARLFISRNTVKFHLRLIYQRLGVRNRVEAADHVRGRGPHPIGWLGPTREGRLRPS
jgi:DNA-binding NarL/FixJ family response regulator